MSISSPKWFISQRRLVQNQRLPGLRPFVGLGLQPPKILLNFGTLGSTATPATTSASGGFGTSLFGSKPATGFTLGGTTTGKGDHHILGSGFGILILCRFCPLSSLFTRIIIGGRLKKIANTDRKGPEIGPAINCDLLQ